MPTQPAASPQFQEFLRNEVLHDPRTIVNAFLNRPVGSIYSVGSRIRGEYEVKGLYPGGMGVVMITYNHRHRRSYALKTLREELLLSARMRSSFERECRFWIGLGKHPYIIQAYFTPWMSGRYFVAIEPVDPDEGGRVTLLDHIRNRALDLGKLLLWAIQVCCAVEYAQQKGMACHRDLKPSNILIDRAGTAKVTDFGTVKTDADPDAGFTYLKGTLPYIAPETLEGRTRSGAARDVWSFGVTLYQSLTGRLPWTVDSSNPRLWAECIRKRPMEKADGPLWPIIERCLTLDVNSRCSSFAELRNDIGVIYEAVTGSRFVARTTGRETPEDLLNRAFSEQQLGNPKTAIGIYRQGLTSGPAPFDRGRLWHNLGRVYSANSEFDSAEECFKSATEVAPDLDRPWIDWARVRLAQGDFAKALDLLERAKTVGSSYVDVWLALGETYQRLGEWRKACESFETAIHIDSTDSASWRGKGESQFMLNERKEARAALRAAVTIDPTAFGISMME